MQRQNKKTFLDDKIKAKEYFDSRRIGLLLKYGIPFDIKKKYYTQLEINEIDKIMEQLEDIDSLLLKYFTPKDCGLLIMNGHYIRLKVFLQSGYKSDAHRALTQTLNEILKEMGKKTKEGTPPITSKPNPKERINMKKVAAVSEYINALGGLNIKEVKYLMDLLGYSIDNISEKTDDLEV